jgi:hypothetical protein
MANECPNCGGSNTQKSSAVVLGGTHQSVGSAAGVGMGGSGLGIGAASTQSTSVSLAAKKNAAPQEYSVGCAALVGFILGAWLGAMIGGFWMALIVALIVAAIVGGWVSNLTKEKREATKAQYDRQWYCHSCGELFSKN